MSEPRVIEQVPIVKGSPKRISRLGWAIIVSIVLSVSSLGLAFGLDAHQTAERRHEACVSRRDLYDGQIFLTKYFAERAGITEKQTTDLLASLRQRLHQRPVC